MSPTVDLVTVGLEDSTLTVSDFEAMAKVGVGVGADAFGNETRV